jgi:hypothetical protein
MTTAPKDDFSEGSPNDCAKCGEDATCVTSGGKSMVRVRRFSKCKFYKPGGNLTCRTGIQPSPQAAIMEWNERFGRLPAADQQEEADQCHE